MSWSAYAPIAALAAGGIAAPYFYRRAALAQPPKRVEGGKITAKELEALVRSKFAEFCAQVYREPRSISIDSALGDDLERKIHSFVSSGCERGRGGDESVTQTTWICDDVHSKAMFTHPGSVPKDAFYFSSFMRDYAFMIADVRVTYRVDDLLAGRDEPRCEVHVDMNPVDMQGEYDDLFARVKQIVAYKMLEMVNYETKKHNVKFLTTLHLNIEKDVVRDGRASDEFTFSLSFAPWVYVLAPLIG